MDYCVAAVDADEPVKCKEVPSKDSSNFDVRTPSTSTSNLAPKRRYVARFCLGVAARVKNS